MLFVVGVPDDADRRQEVAPVVRALLADRDRLGVGALEAVQRSGQGGVFDIFFLELIVVGFHGALVADSQRQGGGVLQALAADNFEGPLHLLDGQALQGRLQQHQLGLRRVGGTLAAVQLLAQIDLRVLHADGELEPLLPLLQQLLLVRVLLLQNLQLELIHLRGRSLAHQALGVVLNDGEALRLSREDPVLLLGGLLLVMVLHPVLGLELPGRLLRKRGGERLLQLRGQLLVILALLLRHLLLFVELKLGYLSDVLADAGVVLIEALDAGVISEPPCLRGRIGVGAGPARHEINDSLVLFRESRVNHLQG